MHVKQQVVTSSALLLQIMLTQRGHKQFGHANPSAGELMFDFELLVHA